MLLVVHMLSCLNVVVLFVTSVSCLCMCLCILDLCSVFVLLISIGVSTERVANLIKVLRSGMFGM